MHRHKKNQHQRDSSPVGFPNWWGTQVWAQAAQGGAVASEVASVLWGFPYVYLTLPSSLPFWMKNWPRRWSYTFTSQFPMTKTDQIFLFLSYVWSGFRIQMPQNILCFLSVSTRMRKVCGSDRKRERETREARALLHPLEPPLDTVHGALLLCWA